MLRNALLRQTMTLLLQIMDGTLHTEQDTKNAITDVSVFFPKRKSVIVLITEDFHKYSLVFKRTYSINFDFLNTKLPKHDTYKSFLSIFYMAFYLYINCFPHNSCKGYGTYR